MPGRPTRSMIHIDQPLTNVSIAYVQNASNFVAGQVFPIVPVAKQSDKYFTFDRGDWNTAGAKRRARGTESVGGGWNMSTGSYFAEEWAEHKNIDDQDRANADQPINLDRSTAKFLTQRMLITREADWASNYFTTGVWTGSTTATDIIPGALWDTVAGTPIDDVGAQVDSILQKTGQLATCLVIGRKVFRALKNHADVLDRVKYTQKGNVTTDLLASLLEVDHVYVANAVQNTAAEDATESMGYILGSNDALLLYVNPSPALEMPSAGYTFAWTGLAGNSYGQGIRTIRVEKESSDRVEIKSTWDHKVVAADCGVFFSNCVS